MKKLLEQLVAAAPTLENGELRAAEVLKDYFEHHGLDAEIDVWEDTRANVLVLLKADSCAASRGPLLIAAHLDVVPAAAGNWSVPPFTATERQGRIYGRGTTDMLGGVAAVSAALVETAQHRKQLRGDILFAVTAGEETDSCGTKRFVQQYRSRFADPVGVLIPEPTDLKIMRAHRGILWLNVQTHGKTAHGSMPHLGINAIEKMNAFLNHLKTYHIPHTPHPLLGGCSMSVNRIAGGSGTNIVPETCALEIDIRTLPGQNPNEIIASLRTIFDALKKDDPDFNADISIIRVAEAIETNAEDPFVEAVCRVTGIDKTGAAEFTTDGPYFQKLNAPVLIFGPGDGTMCHKPDEYIETSELERARKLYKTIIC